MTSRSATYCLWLLLLSVPLPGCSRDWTIPPKPSDGGLDAESPLDSEVAANDDAGALEAAVERAKNEPTVGGFVTTNEPRRNGAPGNAALILRDDGFELGPTVCDVSGRCVTASFSP